jgi:hypothetical protein
VQEGGLAAWAAGVSPPAWALVEARSALACEGAPGTGAGDGPRSPQSLPYIRRCSHTARGGPVGVRATRPLRASGLHRAPAAAEGDERGTMCLGADVVTRRPGRREPMPGNQTQARHLSQRRAASGHRGRLCFCCGARQRPRLLLERGRLTRTRRLCICPSYASLDRYQQRAPRRRGVARVVGETRARTT